MFPVAHCAQCQTDRLTYGDFVGDTLARKCLNCDHLIDDPVQLLDATAVSELGYVIQGHEPASGKRGCKDGACGVQQPQSAVGN